jgi:23S rRNA (cytosine1962-C5)-methyltransferase
VDRFSDVAVIHVDSPELLDRWIPELKAELVAFTAAFAKVHPRAASRLTPTELDKLAPAEPLWGSFVHEVEVVENGVQYAVRPGAGLSAGLFLDMREVRNWVRHNAAGRTVLNVFAYTCAFGVSASLGKAKRVVNVDVSRRYLEWGQANYRLNDVVADQRDFIYGDALDWLDRFARRQSRFDLVIVDPPSFSSTPFSVSKDYPRLIEAAARVVAPAGMLLAATNHAGTTDVRFEAWIRAGLAFAGRQGQAAQRWHEPQPDFPVAAGQRPYLKVRALVLD